MFLHVAEVVGEAYGLEPVQHLDLLVRDWSSSLVLGAQGGDQHLRDVRQKLAVTSPCKHPKALEVLSRSSSCCYLMPFPGEQITTGSEGTLRDMDEDFRDSLRDYVTTLVGSVSQQVRRDRHGELLTRTQLAAKIKNLSDVMKKHRSGFSSPCQDVLSQRMVDCLKVDPGAMADQLAEQRRSLLGRCREEMKEPEETLLTALEVELTREAETFLETYGERYQRYATNQRAMDRARQDHADFLREKDVLSQRMVDCLTVDPSTMADQFAEQRRSLLGQCREEMKEPEETLLTALEVELTWEAETFLETYRRWHQRYTINQKAMDRARQDHAAFLRHMRRERECQLVRALVSRIMARVRECNVQLFTGEAILVGSQAQDLHVQTESSSSDYDFLVPIQYNTNLILMGSLYSKLYTPKGLLPVWESLKPGVPVYRWGNKVVVDYNKLIMRDLLEKKTVDIDLTEEDIKTINGWQLQLWKNGVTISYVMQGLYNCVKALTQESSTLKDLKSNCPAVQLIFQWGKDEKVSVDLVPAIQGKVALSEKWLRDDLARLSDWWAKLPDNSQERFLWKTKTVGRVGADVVAKDDFWRFSFANAETAFLQDIDSDGGQRRKALRLLKFLNKECWVPEYGKILTSYYLKTVLLWAQDIHPEKEKWETLELSLKTLLSLLRHCVNKGKLPHYFLRHFNLFNKRYREGNGFYERLALQVLTKEVELMNLDLVQYISLRFSKNVFESSGAFSSAAASLQEFKERHWEALKKLKKLEEKELYEREEQQPDRSEDDLARCNLEIVCAQMRQDKGQSTRCQGKAEEPVRTPSEQVTFSPDLDQELDNLLLPLDVSNFDFLNLVQGPLIQMVKSASGPHCIIP